MISKPSHFTAKEIFHPSFIAQYGEQGVWEIRPALIWDRLDAIRVAWGKPIIINRDGWRNCGVREVMCKIGAPKSRHKPIYEDVQAFDLHGADHDETGDLFLWLETHGHLYGVERLESFASTPGWVHCEICTHNTPNPPKVFTP